jgi:hypothetical protein
MNFLEDKIFYITDFQDGDHLNHSGTLKLTAKIDSIIMKSRANLIR